MSTFNTLLGIIFKLTLIVVALATWGIVDIVDIVDDVFTA